MLSSGKITTALLYIPAIFFALFMLWYGKTLFVPMLYGLFVAAVMYPFCMFLEKHGWNRSLAVGLSLSIVLVLFLLLFWILFLQLNSFRSDLPLLKSRMQPAMQQLQSWTENTFGFSKDMQDNWLSSLAAKFSDEAPAFLQTTFSAAGKTFFTFIMAPVFAAFFLYNRSDFILFLKSVAGEKYSSSLHQILHKTLHTYFHFIKGMIIVYIIVGTLNTAGLLLLGVEHAVLFGFLTAIMTIIPYIGIIVSSLLPISVAWISTGNILYPLGVIAVFAFVQYLEANIIFPKVVAAQLNLSTWATLVAILAGGILWGVSGMILFIPIAGVMKIISDEIPELKPLNILLSRNNTIAKAAEKKGED